MNRFGAILMCKKAQSSFACWQSLCAVLQLALQTTLICCKSAEAKGMCVTVSGLGVVLMKHFEILSG